MTATVSPPLLRKLQVAEVLEHLCQSLELTEAQFLQAKERYEGVGSWLDGADEPLLRTVEIYLQGSAALRTTVRPLNRTEHDVDLIAHCPNVSSGIAPTVLKRTIGDRLRGNPRYAPILEEKARCWRLSYANEFHLDITPAIPNLQGAPDGELVPDKVLKDWSPSNPRGYRRLFQQRAALSPTLYIPQGFRAQVETFPQLGGPKGILRRVVQIAKRHRDQYFSAKNPELAPISIIITTLASQSYERCVHNGTYDNAFDFLCAVIQNMPLFIETRPTGWFVWNETTRGENFAEKWNTDPRLERAFKHWHGQAVDDLGRLLASQGLDDLSSILSRSFGPTPARRAIVAMTQRLSVAREKSLLRVAPGVGLTTSKATPRATTVRTNTFYGQS